MRYGAEGAQAAEELSDMGVRLDAVELVCELKADDPTRLGLIRSYLRECEEREVGPDADVIRIFAGGTP